ncbi:MAG: YbjN domain-containing protein [Ruminococcaceae bacterium]|nr:YbjN domain-containing protein [Oscillospiraceae bacterium]
MNACAEAFAALLESKGLQYQSGVDKDGDSVIDFPYNGKVTKCFFAGEDGAYFSLYQVYERIPEDKYADLLFLCNELNCRYKWATFYVDGDRDLVIHDDALLTVDTAADEAFELLVRIIKIVDDVKPAVMKAIYA